VPVSFAKLRIDKQGAVLLALAVLWLILRVPQLGARFSFDWDSSQYARGIAEFNVAKHQPHPPGYLLYVLAARGFTDLGAGPMQAQIAVAFTLAVLALIVFYALARDHAGPAVALPAVILLAFSPGVGLYSATSSPDITDLLTSCVAGYLVFLDPKVRPWRIVACVAALGLLGGFRQSGVSFVAPLVAVSLVAHLRYARREVLLGTLLASVVFFSWYLPLTQSAGGWHALSHLISGEFRTAAVKTSVFYGASTQRHLNMIEENTLYFGMNVVGWLVAFGLPKRLPAGWWRYALWLMPNLVMLFAIHGPKVGYCLLSFPPLLLLLCSARPHMLTLISAVLISLGISYCPYGRLLSMKHWVPAYLAYKSTPRLALDLETSQRRLDQALRGIPRDGICARELPEAPDIRTVTYDFSYISWSTPDTATPPSAVWLFDQHGPDEKLRARYPTWRRIYGDELNSLWITEHP